MDGYCARRFGLRVAVALSLHTCVAFGLAADGPATKPAPAPPQMDGKPLTKTVVTAVLDHPIGEGKNVVWCASFQLAWNALMDMAGEPIVLQPRSPLAEALNERRVDKACLPPGSVVAEAGLVADGILPRIRQALAKTFGDSVKPRLLPADGELPDAAVVAYAYLCRNLRFRTPFARLDSRPFVPASQPARKRADAEPQRVRFFGIEDYEPSDARHKALAEQVDILWHCFDVHMEQGQITQRFVIELKTASKDDRLVLARIESAATLAETIRRCLAHVTAATTRPTAEAAQRKLMEATQRADAAEWDPAQTLQEFLAAVSAQPRLMDEEDLAVPVMDFDLEKAYAQLHGRVARCKDSRIDGKPVVEAKQGIRFRLNEKGAELESEASLTLFGDVPERRFSFAQPFLLMMLAKGASQPFLAMWIGNDELLVKDSGSASRPADEDKD